MPLLRTVRPFAAVVLATLLLTTTGCPSASEKPTDKEPQARTPQKSADDDLPLVKLPVAEFQQPPVVPSGEPLAKPARDPVEVPVLAAAKKGPSPPMRSVTIAPPQPSAPFRSVSPPDSAQPEAAAPERPSRPKTGKPQTGKNSGIPFDPIKENGPIFVGWPKPKVALVITGMEEGYMEPCGCAGLDRMKGGMSRRATFFKQLRQKGWPVVGLDVGRAGPGLRPPGGAEVPNGRRGQTQDGLRCRRILATDDLRLPAGELVAVAAGVDDKPSLVRIRQRRAVRASRATLRHRAASSTAGGMKIGVTAILGKKYQDEIHDDEIEMLDPEEALEKIVPELKQKADYLVLLAHATKDESIALGKKFPEFNVVVTSDGHAGTAPRPRWHNR